MVSMPNASASSSRSVLIAGGAGYIGSHAAKALAQAGWTPVVLDNLCTGDRAAARFGPFHEGSVADSKLVAELVERYRPAGAMLFAGHAYVGESTQNPRKYFQNNVTDSLKFLDCLIDAGVRNVVFSSSCSVYGLPSVVPISEANGYGPLSPYAETKAFFERVLHWYGAAYGLRAATLRYFNAAGADPDGELGESHEPETHLIPLVIQAALGGAPIEVFGTDYPTPDGTAIRDYTHVTDLADAHVRALTWMLEHDRSLTLNLGSGAGQSVREVIVAVESASGRPVPVRYGPRRTGDAPALVADPAQARDLLGWTARHSSLSEIVLTAFGWTQSHQGPR